MEHSISAARGVVFDRAYDFVGYRFRVVSDVDDAADLAGDLLKPFEAAANGRAPTYAMLRAPGEINRYTFHRDGECLLDETRAYPAAMVDLLISNVTRKAIEAQEGQLAVHASAASWAGRGVIMPAATGSGKTTTVAGLVRAGMDYLSDEAALVDLRTNKLHPFPRPLAMDSVRLIEGLTEELPARYHELMRRQQYYVPCDFLRTGSWGSPCPVRYVIAPAYSSDSVTEIQPLSRPRALALLAGQAFNLDRFGPTGLELLADVVRDARCYSLRIGDLHDAVALIMEIVRDDD